MIEPHLIRETQQPYTRPMYDVNLDLPNSTIQSDDLELPTFIQAMSLSMKSPTTLVESGQGPQYRNPKYQVIP
jgi:hypothetical protein